MKVFTIFSLLCFLFISSACQNQTVLSQQTGSSEKNDLRNSNRTAEIPSDEDVGIDVEKLVSDKDFLQFDGFKIKKVIRKKKEDNSPEAHIEDAVLERNGKRILEFDGVYYPLGNQMQFGRFSLTKSKDKDLLVYDNSQRFGRLWVVSFEKGAKQIFDSDDWGGFREFINFIDLDDDGIYEFTMAQYNDAGFEYLASVEIPLMSIIFKYDEKTEKYLPANYKFQEKAKEIIEKEDVENKLTFNSMMENFLEILYAGMEKEAWEYFDKNYDFPENLGKGLTNSISNSNLSKTEKLSEKSKREIRTQIENSLKKNKIYQFLESEASKNR